MSERRTELVGTLLISGAALVAGAAALWLLLDYRESRKRLPRFPPELLRAYTVQGEIGRGLTSVVHAGVHRATGRKVAIKIVPKSDGVVRASRAMEVELSVLAKMSHPHIIQLYDTFDTEHHVCLVMERALGGELFDHVERRGHYSERDARVVFARLLDALLHLHRQNIMHRDLKLENILLADTTSDTNVKLCDFGFAKVMDTGLPSRRRATTSCGTRGYTAPEMLRGREYGFECDYWSLGVILYILLVGYPPFHETPVDLEWEPDFALPGWDAVSAEGKDLVSRLLKVDPSHRAKAVDIVLHPWLDMDQGLLRDAGAVQACIEEVQSDEERARRAGGVELRAGTGSGSEVEDEEGLLGGFSCEAAPR